MTPLLKPFLQSTLLPLWLPLLLGRVFLMVWTQLLLPQLPLRHRQVLLPKLPLVGCYLSLNPL
jgi:hypothetical protein